MYKSLICYIKYIWVPFSTSLLILTCSSGQTGGADSEELKKNDIQTISNTEEQSTLNIETGNLKNTITTIPAGALAIGTKVGMKEASTTPTSFTNAGTPASSPVNITATDADGNPVTELSVPMKIQIPISNTALHLATESTEDNLCALLETPNQNYYVWRRSALTIENNFTIFQSKRLGIFQLVYCGSEPLDGFEEAAESGIGGDASESLINITLSANSKYNRDFGHTHICVGIATNVHDNSPTFYSLNNYPHTPKNEITLKMTASQKNDINQLEDDSTAYMFFLFQADDQQCDESKLSDDSDESSFYKAAFLFPTKASNIKSSNISGNFGETGGDFALKSVYLKIGREDGGTFASTNNSDICIETTSSTSNGGWVELTSNITTGSKINGGETLEAFYVDNSNSNPSLHITHNSKICYDTSSYAGNSTSTTQIYLSNHKSFTENENLYITPLDLSLGLSSIAAFIDKKRVCIRIYPKDTTITGRSESEKQNLALVNILTSITETSTYKLYLPYEAGSIYTVGFKHLSESENCATDKQDEIEAYNKSLEGSLNVQASDLNISYP